MPDDPDAHPSAASALSSALDRLRAAVDALAVQSAEGFGGVDREMARGFGEMHRGFGDVRRGFDEMRRRLVDINRRADEIVALLERAPRTQPGLPASWP